MILATEEGLVRLGFDKHHCVQIAGWGQAVDPLQHNQRHVLEPAGAYRAMNSAYAWRALLRERFKPRRFTIASR
jgi:hypothetical protein